MARSTARFRHDQVQGFRKGQALKQATPFARVPMPGQVEATSADEFQPGEGRVEFRREGTRSPKR